MDLRLISHSRLPLEFRTHKDGGGIFKVKLRSAKKEIGGEWLRFASQVHVSTIRQARQAWMIKVIKVVP